MNQAVKSMTGYGRATEICDGREMTIEVKTVNHRYLDVALRLPRLFSALEEDIRKILQNQLDRGHVEFYINYKNHRDDAKTVEADLPLAKAYLSALREMAKGCELKDDVSLGYLGRLPEVLTVTESEEDQEALKLLLDRVLNAALDQLIGMRETEGERMAADVSGRIGLIEEQVGLIEKRSEETVSEYYEKLRSRLEELLSAVPIDQDRIVTEAAIYADRVSIAEETVRLRSHMKQFLETLSGPQPCGRKLDFIVQEMNREINTIGSKASDSEIMTRVVTVKSEIEKIREQVQNIE